MYKRNFWIVNHVDRIFHDRIVMFEDLSWNPDFPSTAAGRSLPSWTRAESLRRLRAAPAAKASSADNSVNSRDGLGQSFW